MHNVWIVDDEPFILEGLAALVDWRGMKLHLAGKAENGLDALEQIDAQGAHVDILITDIAMPEMDGLTLLRKLKDRNPELKGIILSGYNEFNYIKEGMKIGIENYLLKPINFEELNQTLISAVENLNRSRIHTLSQDQVEMLKDNILYRWVTDRIGQEQWKLRSDFLQLKLNAPLVAAAVIQPDPMTSGDADERSLLIRDQTQAFMAASGFPFLCFQNTDDNTVILAGLEDRAPDSHAKLVQLLSVLAVDLKAAQGAKIIISLGSLENGFEKAPASYKNAVIAQDYALLFPGEDILSFERVASFKDGSYTPSSDSDSYARLVLAHDLSQLSKQIEDDLHAFSQLEGMTPAGLRHAAVEMVMQMKKLLKDFNPSHPIFVSYHDIVDRLMSSSSLEVMKELVLSMARFISDLLSERQEQSPVIRQILGQIETAYMKEFSLKSLAQDYRVHPVYLGQLFQRETGQTFSDYLNRLRIEKAVELMKTTTMKTQDVAEAVGYWDTAHFYKHFKKYVGVAPAQYRKML